MTGEDFIMLWANKDLRQCVLDMVKSITRNKQYQAALYRGVWRKIAKLDSDKTDEYYIRYAYCYIRRKYQLYIMPIPRAGRKPSEDSGIQRISYKIKHHTGFIANP